MFSSTSNTLLLIVFAYLILECTCPPIDREKLSARASTFDFQMKVCLNNIALYYRITLPEGITITELNYEEAGYQITSKECAKNAIRYLTYPRIMSNVPYNYYKELVNNINPENIDDVLEFCGCKEPVCQCLNFSIMSQKTRDCLDDLDEFPEDSESALKYALKNITLVEGQGNKTTYMNHIIEKFDLKGSVLEPIDYCKNNIDKYPISMWASPGGTPESYSNLVRRSDARDYLDFEEELGFK